MIQRRSKIAKLPEPIRDQVNEFLAQFADYGRILDWLATRGHPEIQSYDLTRWKDSGYQDWLQRQEHLEELDIKLNWLEKLASQGPATLQKAGMTVLALKLFDTLHRTDATEISKLLEAKPEKIPTLINCFTRFCHESLELEKFNDKVREREEETQLIDKGTATPDTIRRMKRELRFALRKFLAEMENETATPLQQTATDCN